MRVRWIVSTVLALVAVGAGTPAVARTVAVGPVGQTSAMSAWGGHVVFSERVAGTSSEWQLMDATAAGIRALHVAPQGVDFTADVGPDAHGRPAAVFTRCAGGSVNPPCHVHEVSLARPGAPARPVRSLLRPGYTEAAPSIWRGRIAFGRTLAGVRGVSIAAIYVQRRPGSRHVVRLARGTVPRCLQTCFRQAQPLQIDLGPRALAMTWVLQGGNTIPQDGQELWRMPLDGRPGTLLDAAGMRECGFGGPISFVWLISPSLTGRRVQYLRTTGDCWATQSAFVRTGPSPLQQWRHRVGGAHLAYGMARDGRSVWWIRGPQHAPPGAGIPDPCTTTPCTLVRSTGVRFSHVHVPRRPTPPIT